MKCDKFCENEENVCIDWEYVFDTMYISNGNWHEINDKRINYA